MYISVRASRVVVGGFDYLTAIDVGIAGLISVPLLGGAASWGLGLGEVAAFAAALALHVAAVLGCRFRLIVDARGSTLVRAWHGVPWSRRSFGKRARVVTDLGWDWEELAIVPEQPRDEEDRFVAVETPPSAWTAADMEAFAAAAEREIARVAEGEAAHPAGYRSAYPRR